MIALPTIVAEVLIGDVAALLGRLAAIVTMVAIAYLLVKVLTNSSQRQGDDSLPSSRKEDGDDDSRH